jgi:hypothetical protein
MEEKGSLKRFGANGRYRIPVHERVHYIAQTLDSGYIEPLT